MMTTIFVFESAAGLMPLMTDDGDDHLFENSPFTSAIVHLVGYLPHT